MPQFAAGVVKFQQEVFPEKRDLFERLSRGQSPEGLFITCSDSRIETAMITQTDPGQLYIIRNAGNIVPPHTTRTGATTASLEFAVAVLKIPHVVVCGHTECGAMKGAMNPEMIEDLPHIREWLGFSQAAVDITRALGGELTEDERMRMLLEQNVVLQLQHLRTHPTVATALACRRLCLHGWIYDIKSGDVTAWDEDKGEFVPVAEHYAEVVARRTIGEHAIR